MVEVLESVITKQAWPENDLLPLWSATFLHGERHSRYEILEPLCKMIQQNSGFHVLFEQTFAVSTMTLTRMVVASSALLVSLSFLSGVWSIADRKIVLRNNSGKRVELNWVNEANGDRVLMSDPDILAGTEFNMDSYVSHRFEVKEVPSKKTGSCKNPRKCSTGFFTVNGNEKQGTFDIACLDSRP